MNYIILRNDKLVFSGATLIDCQAYMNANKATFSESDVFILYKIDKTATINTTITYV